MPGSEGRKCLSQKEDQNTVLFVSVWFISHTCFKTFLKEPASIFIYNYAIHIHCGPVNFETVLSQKEYQNKFDVWLTVHLNSVKITKPTRCHFV